MSGGLFIISQAVRLLLAKWDKQQGVTCYDQRGHKSSGICVESLDHEYSVK